MGYTSEREPSKDHPSPVVLEKIEMQNVNDAADRLFMVAIDHDPFGQVIEIKTVLNQGYIIAYD